jgi:hypothetical protein
MSHGEGNDTGESTCKKEDDKEASEIMEGEV